MMGTRERSFKAPKRYGDQEIQLSDGDLIACVAKRDDAAMHVLHVRYSAKLFKTETAEAMIEQTKMNGLQRWCAGKLDPARRKDILPESIGLEF